MTYTRTLLCLLVNLAILTFASAQQTSSTTTKCNVCSKTIGSYPGCHCSAISGVPCSKNHVEFKTCSSCEEKARRQELMNKKNNLLAKIADLRRQIAAIDSGGKTVELRAKLAKTQALLAQIQSDSELDPADRASLSNSASAKITSLQQSINDIAARKAALTSEVEGFQGQVNDLDLQIKAN